MTIHTKLNIRSQTDEIAISVLNGENLETHLRQSKSKITGNTAENVTKTIPVISLRSLVHSKVKFAPNIKNYGSFLLTPLHSRSSKFTPPPHVEANSSLIG